MPVIRVEVPAGTPADTQKTIRIAVKAAVLKTLAPKETKYDYVAVREVVGEIGDGVPLVEVDLRPGREPERKKALVDAIAEILNDTMGVEAADVYVVFRENPAENHYCGGTPLPLWVPADAIASRNAAGRAVLTPFPVRRTRFRADEVQTCNGIRGIGVPRPPDRGVLGRRRERRACGRTPSPDRATFHRGLGGNGRIEPVHADVWGRVDGSMGGERLGFGDQYRRPLRREARRDIRQDPRTGSPACRPTGETSGSREADPYLGSGCRSRVGLTLCPRPGDRREARQGSIRQRHDPASQRDIRTGRFLPEQARRDGTASPRSAPVRERRHETATRIRGKRGGSLRKGTGPIPPRNAASTKSEGRGFTPTRSWYDWCSNGSTGDRP